MSEARPSLRRKTILDGKYQLVAPVGLGETATVWKALVLGAAGFQRTVAVKRILPQYRDDADYMEMFVAEAKTGAQLAHQNIVQVYDFCGSAEKGYFLVMDWVEGCSLGALIDWHGDKATPWEEMTFAVAASLNGLADAHEHTDEDGEARPIIHRDFCPNNILLGVRGEVKISDFGLAVGENRNLDPNAPAVLRGNPLYAAPELFVGVEPNEATDVYAAGIVLWEALAGRRAFSGEKDEILKAILKGDLPAISEIRGDLPPALVDIVTRATATDPDSRPPSAWDMADELFVMLRNDAAPYLKPRLGIQVRKYRTRDA
jgi:serine/threonine-protein kinase